MEKIEVLLKKELASSFDTPKKLNRSSLAIEQSVIDNLENGVFTCESIDLLSAKYPIFKYRTCITVHGSWPEISRTRIGGYKNVHQNLNGSVEVRYSAIDSEKMQTIAENLRACESNFRFQENSNERGFYWMLPITCKDDVIKAQTKMQPIAERLTKLNIYGHVSLYTARDFFRQYLVLALVPLALPENMVLPLTLELTGLDSEQLQTKIALYRAEVERKEIERKKERLEYEQKEKAKKEQIIARANDVRPVIAHLSECNDITAGILVKVFYEVQSDKIRFAYYQKTGNGAFGRVKWSKAFSDVYTDQIEGLKWIEQKQKMINEFNLKEFRLVRRAQTYNRRAA